MLQNHVQTFFSEARAHFRPIILLSISLFLILLTGKAQNAQTVYVGVNYIKVTPGKGSTFNNLLNTYSKQLNEDYFNSGKIMGWYTHNVLMPTGSSAEYDMTIVTVTNNMNLLLDDTTSIWTRFRKILPGASDATIQMIFDSYSSSRTIVKREIYSFVDGLNTSSSPSKYVQVDYMKATPGKESEYVKLEKDIYKPLHAEMVKKGGKDDWGLYALEMPYSSVGAYDYITGNFFSSLTQGNGMSYTETFKKVFPKMDVNAVSTQTNNARKIVRSEMWKLGVFIDATNTKK